jgi:methyltransferase family protein
MSETSRFKDSFFHFIYSFQLFEHVKDLRAVIVEMSRLTGPGGAGIHVFPASKRIIEPHLEMPFVHWLPKNAARKGGVALAMSLGYGPPSPWPETRGKGFWCKVETYYQYLNNETYYRDIEDICGIVSAGGLFPEYLMFGDGQPSRWLPSSLRRNGFPGQSVALFVTRTQRHGAGSRNPAALSRAPCVPTPSPEPPTPAPPGGSHAA